MATYVVKSGDTLTSIATAHHTTVALLEHYNPKITNPNEIYVNEVLTLPPAQGPLPGTVQHPHPVATVTPTTTHPNAIVSAALHRMSETHTCRPGTCDHMCAGYYGLGASGYYTAYDNALAVPERYRHSQANAKEGMIGFWSGGSHHYGHAAPFYGDHNHIRSSDMSPEATYAPGEVNTIPWTAIHTNWGLTFMFATDPYFAGRLITTV